MNRRAFVTGLSAVLAAPLGAGAQQAGNAYRVGLLTGGSEPGSRTRLEAFRKSLRELGYVDGTSIALEYRYASDNYDRLPALAAELVRLNVSVIVANGTPASLAAKQATSVIPIVMFETADPVGSKLVSSVAKPGGNITGVAQLVSIELFGKQLEMLKEILPKVSRVGLLFNPANPVQLPILGSIQVAAQALGVRVQPLSVEHASGLENELATAARSGVGALIVTRDNIFIDHLGRLVDLTARYRMPTMYGSRPFAKAGGLIAYGPDPDDMAKRAAVYVDKILKGAKPGDLPIEQPTKFELVINLSTARTLGLTIPPSLLLRADQVVE
jgi:putative tryptophan/tyrosine transport system substrate-binding protein